MTFRLTISRAIVAFGLLAAISFGAIIATSYLSLGYLKVGGPLYNKIKLGNDLIADILPPPEYVIEAYLEVTLALRDPASLAARRERLSQLKKDYDDRREYWLKSDLDPALKELLIEKSDAEVRKFWTAVEQKFLPSVQGGKPEAAAAGYAEVASAYTAHRAIIDEIVKQTTDANAATEAEATASLRSFSIALWSVSGLAILIVMAGVVGVGFGVVRPITGMTGVMKKLAEGDLAVSIPFISRKDEVGAMAHALEVFRENAQRVRQMEAEHDSMKERAEADRKAAMTRVANELEVSIGRIARVVSSASSEIDAAAATLTRTAEATQGLSSNAASASEQSSQNVNSAAAASEEMAASVSEIAKQVEEASRIARAAVSQAEQTNERVAELSQAAGRIGEVVKMITNVADQTNLLALNATIEAARAGEAGRGFAVVATEVKALASQTAKATDEISSQIAQMQDATAESVGAIKEISATIARISEISTAISAAVEEQGAATQEIARNVSQAACGASEVASSIGQVNRGAVDTGAAATQVRSTSAALLKESNRLSQEVDKFVAAIRAA
ncbi:MAG: methyl-accepting chemotaxis protein [Bradyrhizobium sp.]|uniref:methyl-accepting chemotaxis protein n=1 Tax=Bradyrhizobium sp. TaxID=376 RepID=UPI0025BF4473|nr:HAMP domain-containing methyl-accepting chemotaxis protein [Bradyrhizobium sp.]MBI5262688.1 methyl-accepting chemotaxis protein [Bradyrhizobium sp.]